MPKCNFNKVAKQIYWNRTLIWVSSCKFSAYFQNIFSKEHLWSADSALTIWCLNEKKPVESLEIIETITITYHGNQLQ